MNLSQTTKIIISFGAGFLALCFFLSISFISNKSKAARSRNFEYNDYSSKINDKQYPNSTNNKSKGIKASLLALFFFAIIGIVIVLFTSRNNLFNNDDFNKSSCSPYYSPVESIEKPSEKVLPLSGDDKLKKLLNGINLLHFNGKLRIISEVVYSELDSGILGMTTNYDDHIVIRISNKLKNNPNTLKRVMLHEAIHAYVFQENLNGGNDGHSEDFEKIRQKILKGSNIGRISDSIDG